jgi:hypothetical protein
MAMRAPAKFRWITDVIVAEKLHPSGAAGIRVRLRFSDLEIRERGEANMVHVYFHCSNAEQVLVDKSGADVEDLVEAHERATRVVQGFLTRPGPHDWRTWTLKVSDEEGEEIFLMPFASVLGRLH